MIHVNKNIILILVNVKKQKLENDLEWKALKTYLDILRMEQENFPKYNTLEFKRTNGVIARTHFNFLKSLRNKPELIYNVLSIDINKINKEENKRRRKENKIEYLKKDAESKIKEGNKKLEKEYEEKKKEIENSKIDNKE